MAPAFFVSALTPTEERAQLEQELRALEQEIIAIEKDITATKQQKETLQNKVAQIQSQVRKLDLQIYQSNKMIGDLGVQIQDTSYSITETLSEIDLTRRQLGDVLQSIAEQDSTTMLEVVFAGDTLSDFFDGVAALEAVNARSKQLLESVQNLNAYLGSQKDSLESEKSQEENFVKIQLLQKQQSQALQEQQQRLLDETKGKESQYQEILADWQARAQQIRSRIFALVGVPDAPTFGEALSIAEYVAGQTGVRPAFLLAILTQESNLGKNVGQCYLKDQATGNGINIRTGTPVSRVMKPMGLSGRKGDVDDFLRITRALGRDPFNTPVSCPLSYGYGGAMGPAQFIPTTWAIYENRLAGILGRSADPWNISDAFLASGTYLAQLGASSQTLNGEWCAALSYFSGSCSSRNVRDYAFYANSVLAIAKQYEEDIALLKN
ncbi:MAG: lytic murein transglycosylase [bacterium]|nr:lytic murein transglycosylase [bacterium]MDZ4231890.1 lytic murein transglycosylase [Candidatus Pacearchaeota archaeon]